MTDSRPGHSIVKEPFNRLGDKLSFMLGLLKSITPDKCLRKGDQEWDRKKVLQYLEMKRRFLRLLMLLMYLTGGQPARGPELGSVKFRNSILSMRNLFFIGGKLFYTTEYTKSRAANNHSYFVVRYLPPEVAQLVLLYITYIRPFSNFLYNQIAFTKNSTDGDYLFCSEESPDKCWEGEVLSDVLQRESEDRLRVKINLWAYRHIVIAMAKAHVKEIAAHFEKDDAVWQQMLGSNPNFNIYAWQAGHKRATNVSTYGLDQAYPGRLQPELLHEYLRISQIWHQWLGFRESIFIEMINNGIIRGKKNTCGREEPKTPTRKRKYIPLEDEEEDMSPKSKRLLRKLEYRKAKRTLKEKYFGS
jgi:hypothetical protein